MCRAHVDTPRYSLDSTEVEVKNIDGRFLVRSVSVHGGVVEGDLPDEIITGEGDSTTLSFKKRGKNKVLLAKEVEFTRIESVEGQAKLAMFRFHRPTDPSTLKLLGARPAVPPPGGGDDQLDAATTRNDKFMEAAQRDHDDVWQEIRAIQNCRHALFIATNGAVFGTLATSWRFATYNGETRWSILWIGLVAAFSLFFIGVFAMIEKARAVNLRRGFLAALAPYLRGEALFSEYWGWPQLKHCAADCYSLRKAGLCSRMEVEDDTCRKFGEGAAAPINSFKRFLPNVLTSFTSLSAFVFVSIFLGLFGVFYVAFFAMIESSVPEYTTRMVVGTVLGGVVGLICACRYPWFLWGVVAGFVISVIGRWIGVLNSVHYWQLSVIFCSITAACVTTLAVKLAQQLTFVRRGKYSFEAEAFSWTEVLRYCNPIPTTVLETAHNTTIAEEGKT